MYKELVIRNIVIIAASLILFFSLSMIVINILNRHNLEKELGYLSAIIENDVLVTNSEDELREFVNRYTKDQQWLELVIATSLGDIIIDSTEDVVADGVHPKLEAFELEKLNADGTAGVIYANGNRLYYIARVNDDIILRTSIALSNNSNYIFLGVFVLAGVLMIVLLVSITLMRKTSNRVTDAFNNIGSHLRRITSGGYDEIEEAHRYEEVSKAYGEINAINKNICQYIAQLNLERNKLNYIIDNISEGLVILDRDGCVFSINNCACAIFGAEKTGENVSYKTLIKDGNFKWLLEKHRKTHKEMHFDYHDKKTDKIYLVSLNCFYGDPENNDGTLTSIILYDVTALRKEEQVKADFIANASHELKTPITSISGFSELLLSGLASSPGAVKEYVTHIHDEAVRMKHTIEELLYLSKLDYSNELINKNKVSLLQLVESCLESYKTGAAEKKVKLSKTGKDAEIYGDLSLLTHMLGNLLDNAIKYNKEGGFVKIRTGTEEGKPFISVSDSGCGIEKQHLDNLFDRFYRVDNSRSRDTGGVGLGLTIVQRICTLHKAELHVDSEYGSGTTFTIIFDTEDLND